jgi:hypothetical protein
MDAALSETDIDAESCYELLRELQELKARGNVVGGVEMLNLY